MAAMKAMVRGMGQQEKRDLAESLTLESTLDLNKRCHPKGIYCFSCEVSDIYCL